MLVVSVSIHAPWEGCDQRPYLPYSYQCCFNSRTLGRVRQVSQRYFKSDESFQFTHPGKGATKIIYVIAQSIQFQFTHPGKGATHHRSVIFAQIKFQFTHPGKGATAPKSTGAIDYLVSIHAPWEGCDPVEVKLMQANAEFQFTHPGKGATHREQLHHEDKNCFNSRTLGRVRQCGAKLRIIGRINKRNLRLGVLS